MDWAGVTENILFQGTRTFGESVKYYLHGYPARDIIGVFDLKTVEVTTGQGVSTSMNAPTLGIRLSDLAAKPTKKDTVTIRGNCYRVIDSQEDGQGGSTLLLNLDES